METLAFVVVVAGMIAVDRLLLTGFRNPRRALLMPTAASTAPCRIDSLLDGETSLIVGTVDAPLVQPALHPPFGGGECVAYHVTADVGTGGLAYTLAAERDAIDFTVSDGSARARVVVRGAHFVLVDHGSSVPWPAAQGWLSRRGVPKGVPGLRLSERTLLAGSLVAVMGRVSWEADPLAPSDGSSSGAYRSIGRRAVFSSTRSTPMLVTNDEAVLRRVV